MLAHGPLIILPDNSFAIYILTNNKIDLNWFNNVKCYHITTFWSLMRNIIVKCYSIYSLYIYTDVNIIYIKTFKYITNIIQNHII